jgi:hypothetical protein
MLCDVHLLRTIGNHSEFETESKLEVGVVMGAIKHLFDGHYWAYNQNMMQT